MYEDRYGEEIIKKLSKLKKKDVKHYQAVRKKMDQILENPEHKYKELRHGLKGLKRVHLGHFVLIFMIDYSNKIISFEDYDHHDKVYQKS